MSHLIRFKSKTETLRQQIFSSIFFRLLFKMKYATKLSRWKRERVPNKQTKKQTKRPKIDSQCFSLKLFYEKIFSNSKAIVSNRNPFASLLLTSQRINLNRRSQSTKSVSLRKIKVK
ncbi:Pyruvate kinase muscle isozyme [Sarcoptes scabiei]|nr:Pyruvate kinase muscle isozyme [Sarcoptes scabiei]